MTDQAKEQSGQDDQSQKFVIKVDGKEVELTQDQITELAQKGQDYTNKTQKLSEEKKALDEQKGKLDNLVKLHRINTQPDSGNQTITQINDEAIRKQASMVQQQSKLSIPRPIGVKAGVNMQSSKKQEDKMMDSMLMNFKKKNPF